MTPQELKNSILQLAIQGKLVEQRPEEGTAAELLRDILTQRRRDTECAEVGRDHRARRNASATAPRPPIPDDEKPFDIPESWEWVRLGAVCEILDSKRRPITKSERTSGPYPYYGASCVQDYVADYIFDEPLVLLGEDGAKWGRGDNSAFRISGKAWVNNHAHVLRPLPEIDHAYLVHTLCILDLRVFVTGTTVPKLNQARMCQILLPLPPLAEQKRIVAKIEELLPLIDRYEKAWSKLEDFNKRFPVDMQKSLLQLAIQGKLVEQRPEEGTAAELLEKIFAAKNAKGVKKNLTQSRRARGEKATAAPSVSPRDKIPDDEKPFDIPESWEWVRLGELCSIATGRRDANFGSPDGKYNFFTCAKKPTKCHSFSFTGESLLLAGNGDIGNITYFWGQFEAYQRTYVLQPYLEGSYLIYLYYHLQSNWVQYNTGMIYGTAIPYIRLGNVQNYLVALPPLAEQKRIVAKLEEFLPLCERLK